MLLVLWLKNTRWLIKLLLWIIVDLGISCYHKIGQTQEEQGLFSCRFLAALGQVNSSRFCSQKIGHSYCRESYGLPTAILFERKYGHWCVSKQQRRQGRLWKCGLKTGWFILKVFFSFFLLLYLLSFEGLQVFFCVYWCLLQVKNSI